MPLVSWPSLSPHHHQAITGQVEQCQFLQCVTISPGCGQQCPVWTDSRLSEAEGSPFREASACPESHHTRKVTCEGVDAAISAWPPCGYTAHVSLAHTALLTDPFGADPAL